MNNKFKTLVVILTKIFGLLCCIAAWSLYNDGDKEAALFGLVIGFGIYFIPDLINAKNKEE